MFLHHLESLLVGERRERLEREYELRVDRARLSQPHDGVLAIRNNVAQTGLYLWTARPGERFEEEHVIYVGRTNSLGRRVTEYLRSFQPHSVNDFKLRVFQERLLLRHKDAHFALYFNAQSGDELSSIESHAIQFFQPLLNVRMKVSGEEQAAFRESFERYYAASFARFFGTNKDT